MRAVVLGSFRQGRAGTPIYRRPFMLDAEATGRPSRFDVELIVDGVRWQYGFEIDDNQVLGEFAYHFPRGRQALVFHREGRSVGWGAPFRSGGRALERLMRDNALLLSVAGAAEDEGMAPLHSWCVTNLRLAKSSNRGSRAALTSDLVQSDQMRDRILSLLSYADLGVTDVQRVPPDPEATERIRRALRILHDIDEDSEADEQIVVEDFVRLTHSGPWGDVDIAPEDESLGTQVWFGLVGPVLQVLDDGAVLLADELDASLHPRLVEKLVGLFQDPRTNSNCAQLIFNSHDTNILGDGEQRVIGRDQVWFTHKDVDGVTDLYPLKEFGPRRDDAIARRYLLGRYGAVPDLNPAEIERALGLVES